MRAAASNADPGMVRIGDRSGWGVRIQCIAPLGLSNIFDSNAAIALRRSAEATHVGDRLPTLNSAEGEIDRA